MRHKQTYKKSWDEQIKEIRHGIHPQFYIDKDKNRVMCKCGEIAVKFREGYLCSTITVVSQCPF